MVHFKRLLQTSYTKQNFNQSSFDYYTSKCYEFENNVSQEFVVQKETRCRLIVSCENGEYYYFPFNLILVLKRRSDNPVRLKALILRAK